MPADGMHESSAVGFAWGVRRGLKQHFLECPDDLLWTAFEHDSKHQDFWRGYARWGKSKRTPN